MASYLLAGSDCSANTYKISREDYGNFSDNGSGF
jgi:hypothetical protein